MRYAFFSPHRPFPAGIGKNARAASKFKCLPVFTVADRSKRDLASRNDSLRFNPCSRAPVSSRHPAKEPGFCEATPGWQSTGKSRYGRAESFYKRRIADASDAGLRTYPSRMSATKSVCGHCGADRPTALPRTPPAWCARKKGAPVDGTNNAPDTTGHMAANCASPMPFMSDALRRVVTLRVRTVQLRKRYTGLFRFIHTFRVSDIGHWFVEDFPRCNKRMRVGGTDRALNAMCRSS